MMNYFGYIENGKMVLNKCGWIVEKQLNWLKQRFWYVNFDIFVIMPNHIHGIIVIDKNDMVGAQDLARLRIQISNKNKINGNKFGP